MQIFHFLILLNEDSPFEKNIMNVHTVDWHR